MLNFRNFRNSVRRIFIELCIVVVFVSFGANLPTHLSYTEAMNYVLQHSNLALHMIVATIVIVEVIILVIRTFISKKRPWIYYSCIGAAFTLLAYTAGEMFAATQTDAALAMMSVGWVGAMITFGIAWFKNRKKVTDAASTN